jgi:hypothetical protein
VNGITKLYITNLPEDVTETITMLFGKNKSLPNYVELFQQDDYLKAAVRAGIQDHYPGFTAVIADQNTFCQW